MKNFYLTFSDFLLVFAVALFLFLLLICVTFPSVSAFNWTQKFSACDSLNLTTIDDCIDFWLVYENPNCTIIQNITNGTEYLYNCSTNYTNITCENCSALFEQKQLDYAHIEEMARISQGCPECEVCTVTRESCDLEISQKISDLSPPVVNSPKNDLPFYQNIVFWLIVGAIFGLGFFVYKKRKDRDLSIPVSAPVPVAYKNGTENSFEL